MALPATMRRFAIALAHADRELYTDLDLRVAQHPSESERYLVARVLARALEHGDGLDFSKGGVSDDTEPALVQRDLRGDLVAWIEVGNPRSERLHKAAKASPRVVVYTWKCAAALRDAISKPTCTAPTRSRSSGFRRSARCGRSHTRPYQPLGSLGQGGSVYLTVGGRLFEGVLDMLGSS